MSDRYESVAETAARWGVSERQVRIYCAQGRVSGSYIEGKTWLIPAGSDKPGRKKRATYCNDLPAHLVYESKTRRHGGIYHYIQVLMSYHSNRMEGCRLTLEQTRSIFESGTITCSDAVRIEDVIETSNHLQCLDYIIRTYGKKLTKTYILDLHRILKQGTVDPYLKRPVAGEFKILPNIVGNIDTAPPESVEQELSELLADYGSSAHGLDDILGFHVRFERIHPFQDGNGRIGRLLMFRECLRNGICPFVIRDEMKTFYIRGLQSWDSDKAFLRDTCLSAQDEMTEDLRKFGVDPYGSH